MSYVEKHIGRVQILTKTTSNTLAYLEKNPVEGITYKVGNDGKVMDYDNENNEYLLMRNYSTKEMCLLKFIDHKELEEYEDINYKRDNEDGTISFITEFYNGGCGFEEALGDLLEDDLSY